MAVGQLELAARVAAGMFVIVAPTLLFLALWRGLQAMRDDELVRRVQERAEGADEMGVSFNVVPQPDSSTVACPNCGTGNRSGVAYCKQCLSPLPGD
jgi:hypothetical protein